MSGEAMGCSCRWMENTWLACARHYADLEAELAEEPRIIPALLAAIKKWGSE